MSEEEYVAASYELAAAVRKRDSSERSLQVALQDVATIEAVRDEARETMRVAVAKLIALASELDKGSA